jgi:hypothetical protein
MSDKCCLRYGTGICSPGCPYFSREPVVDDRATGVNLDSILEARGERYGAFIDNAIIAQQIKRTMQAGKKWGAMPDDAQEALDQIACKISRLVTGDPLYVDNWDDIAGYATCVAKRLRGQE